MDYKYIEQLLERYWRCETSLQEEEILRLFFSQEEVPADLLPLKTCLSTDRNRKRLTFWAMTLTKRYSKR